MNKEDEGNLLRWLQDKDISEVLDLLMRHGNRYSRRILKFFRWFCKYTPIILMLFHSYGIYEFSQHHREIVHPLCGECTLLSLHIFYGVRSANGSYTGKQILFPMLEIPHSILLLFRHQCCSHRGVELVHY